MRCPTLLVLAALSITPLTACRNNRPSELTPANPQVEALFYGFKDQDPAVVLPPKTAFAVRETCPRITKARYQPGEGMMGTLTLWGVSLERAGWLSAHEGGPVGDAPPHLEKDGSLRFALGCRTCELVLGMQVEGVKVGCLGPGYSLNLERGRLVRSPTPQQQPL
ncbi:MAG: hypothetical protein H6739_08700 [Alphaproteobacteria bacterium]|nr:hypothetical protein [Alphaproteobacteria bacterium]